MKYRKLSDLKKLENNPRTIKKPDMDRLIKSITDNPDYFEARPLILSDRTGELVIIAGNQRYEASRILGLEQVPTYLIENLTEDREKEIIIRDNVANGDWDYDILANDWDLEELADWGLVLDKVDDEFYTRNITTPTYEPSDEQPELSDLVGEDKTSELIDKIEKSAVSDEEKDFLKRASYRHYVFDYSKIADYYSHASPEMQELMEDSALVIIDYNKAIEAGYVELSQKLMEQTYEDNES